MTTIKHILKLIDDAIKDFLLRKDAYELLSDHVNIPKLSLRFHLDTPVDESTLFTYKKQLNDLMNGKPLHRILGYRYFWKDKFELSPDTLEPRPDTEILIESCLKYRPDQQEHYKILDLGTGSGCILLSLLKEYVNSEGVGVDISKDALKMAAHNAGNLGLNSKVSWVHSDWCDRITETFDIIVSNPPYIPSDHIQYLSNHVKNYDPVQALDGGKDGLDIYKRFACEFPLITHSDSLILLEIGYDQGISVPALFKAAGYNIVNLVKDYSGRDRCVVLSMEGT